jgi:hypothetical protein
LKRKFSELETWWRQEFGEGLEGLTDAEVRNLLAGGAGRESFDAIRDRLLAARRKGPGGVSGRPLGESEADERAPEAGARRVEQAELKPFEQPAGEGQRAQADALEEEALGELRAVGAEATSLQERIRALVAGALAGGRTPQQSFLNLGILKPELAERVHAVLRAAGNEADVTGARFVLTDDAVRHIFRQHGDEASEAARGQRAVQPQDFERLPEILTAPDRVEAPQTFGRDLKRRDLVKFTKQIEDEFHVVLVAFAGQARRRLGPRLQIVSMFKLKGGSGSGLPAGAPVPPKGSQELNVRNAPAPAAPRQKIGAAEPEIKRASAVSSTRRASARPAGKAVASPSSTREPKCSRSSRATARCSTGSTALGLRATALRRVAYSGFYPGSRPGGAGSSARSWRA